MGAHCAIMTDEIPNDDEMARHARKMAKKKVARDRQISKREDERGVLTVLTGKGKGKTSAAIGMVVRAAGHGIRCAVIEFIKGPRETGEHVALKALAPTVSVHIMGEGLTWETQDRRRDMAATARAWQVAETALNDPDIGLVILDELSIALKYDYLSLDQILPVLEARPAAQHVVVTGRNAPEDLMKLADTVTDMANIKHAFQAGVRAQPGLEF